MGSKHTHMRRQPSPLRGHASAENRRWHARHVVVPGWPAQNDALLYAPRRAPILSKAPKSAQRYANTASGATVDDQDVNPTTSEKTTETHGKASATPRPSREEATLARAGSAMRASSPTNFWMARSAPERGGVAPPPPTPAGAKCCAAAARLVASSPLAAPGMDTRDTGGASGGPWIPQCARAPPLGTHRPGASMSRRACVTRPRSGCAPASPGRRRAGCTRR